MSHATTTLTTLSIGIDLGDRFSHFCVLDTDGEVVEEGRLRTTPDAFRQRFVGIAGARIALEAGTHSPWVSELLKQGSHDVLVANPGKLRMIYKSDNKTDRFDAEQLARVARMDPRLLSPIQHRSTQVRADLAVLRARNSLVVSRTMLVNHVRGPLRRSVPACRAARHDRSRARCSSGSPTCSVRHSCRCSRRSGASDQE